MFVLDTNVLSELHQGKPKQSMQVRAWAAGQPARQLFLTAISILELEKGVMALERGTPPQGAALRVWLTGVRASFARPYPAFHRQHCNPVRSHACAQSAF